MTENELRISLLLSCQRALLGAITFNIRKISLACDGLNVLYFRAIFDSEPTEENIDDMEAVISEIHADLPFQTDNGAECIFDQRPQSQLDTYEWVVYARKEN